MPPLELIGVKAVLFKFPFTSWTWFGLYFMSLVTTCHRRRIELEDKAKVTVELNRLFQKDRGNTASAARILSPNPMRRPLPCLLSQSLLYASLLYRMCTVHALDPPWWKVMERRIGFGGPVDCRRCRCVITVITLCRNFKKQTVPKNRTLSTLFLTGSDDQKLTESFRY